MSPQHPSARSVLEPERSADRQPQAARRVSGANQCSSPLELSAGEETPESAGGPAHSKTWPAFGTPDASGVREPRQRFGLRRPNALSFRCRTPQGRRTFVIACGQYRPEITDPAQRFPTIPMRREAMVGTRCAASEESFVPAHASASSFSPFSKRLHAGVGRAPWVKTPRFQPLM